MNPPPTTVACHIRPMIRRDMPDVLDISDMSYTQPWHPSEFKATLSERNVLSWVAEGLDDRVIGYLIYRFEPRHLVIVNMAVHDQCRRCGIGTAMLDKLKAKLTHPKCGVAMKQRTGITATVIEVDTTALKFFQANGFRATEVIRDCFEVDGVKRDGYRMEWTR